MVGAYAVLAREPTKFGMRAVQTGPTSVLILGRETFEAMRLKRPELDQALVAAEDYLEQQGVPQVDFVSVNENSLDIESPQAERAEGAKRFRRAVRRLAVLARAARKVGLVDYDPSVLLHQLSSHQQRDEVEAEPPLDELDELKAAKPPSTDEKWAWISTVLGQLSMQELISDDVLTQINSQVATLAGHSKRQSIIFEVLKQEMRSVDFGELFKKDPELMTKVQKILNNNNNNSNLQDGEFGG